MKFVKMQALGNDYVYMDTFSRSVDDPSALAARISDRHFGVGSDGLILITPSGAADVGMRMFNSDGSESAMCGNGIRCVGKYVYDSGLCRKTVMTVETAAGIRTLELFPENGRVCRVRVDMGEPELRPPYIPLALKHRKHRAVPLDLEQGASRPVSPGAERGALSPRVSREPAAEAERFVNQDIFVAGQAWPATAVSMGNPHAVIFLDSMPGFSPDMLESLDLERIGPLFERHPLFPERVNAEFVTVESPTSLRMRVWERGAGETLACGTGACAVAVAGVLNGLSGRRVTVRLKGGDLDIEWNDGDNRVYMAGEAVTVFHGELCI